MRRLFSVACLSLLAACASQAPRKYVVFFSNQSAELDQAGQEVVAQVAQEADRHPSRIVRLKGMPGLARTCLPMHWWRSSGPRP